MGAAGLLDIKKRIKSVENTKKITNAKALVATSKLRKTKKELVVNNKFTESMEPIVRNIATTASEDGDNIYFDGNNNENKLYVVMTSDAGLCGGFNGGVVSYLQTLVGDKKKNSKIIVVGNRGIGYVKRAKLDTVGEYVDISDLPTVRDAKVIFDKALQMFIDGEVSEVNVVYSKFISTVRQEPSVDRILPIEKIEGKINRSLIEPNVEIVLEDAINIYLNGKIRGILLHSKCSEQSASMTAMDGATKNANDLLSALKLKYNRIRQGAITQEISEIVGGAAAQK